MAIKTFKTVTPGLRHRTASTYNEVTKTTPEKALTVSLKKTGGRNNSGYITCRHVGGGHKKKYRVVDFKRSCELPATVKAIEYDPNRNARIALICYVNGVKSYILAPKDIKVGDVITSGKAGDIKPGNCMEIGSIPEGILIHNIELQPGKGGQMCRAAGTSAQILGKEDRYASLRLASGEVRKVLLTCRATIGTVGNEDYNLVHLGKAGRTRWLGTRPTVRGSAMNPNDHPHGGGEGKCPVGRDAPRTPWGKRAMGVKTRKQKKSSTRLIMRSRNGK